MILLARPAPALTRLPDTAPQTAIWMAVPPLDKRKPWTAERRVQRALVSLLENRVSVTMMVSGPAEARRLGRELKFADHVDYQPVPVTNPYVRAYGPIFASAPNTLVVTGFKAGSPLDDASESKVAKLAALPYRPTRAASRAQLMDFSESGVAITGAEGRNVPPATENAFRELLGVHTLNVRPSSVGALGARFGADGRTLLVSAVTVVPADRTGDDLMLPHPRYLDFFVCNGLVVAPKIDAGLDSQARSVFQTAFPKYDVAFVDARGLDPRQGGLRGLVVPEFR